MNEKIKTILQTVKGGMYIPLGYSSPQGSTNYWGMSDEELQKFAELIVSSVLDEVNERSYYTGDRDWSDELDRKWIELEFGFGELAELKK